MTTVDRLLEADEIAALRVRLARHAWWNLSSRQRARMAALLAVPAALFVLAVFFGHPSGPGLAAITLFAHLGAAVFYRRRWQREHHGYRRVVFLTAPERAAEKRALLALALGIAAVAYAVARGSDPMTTSAPIALAGLALVPASLTLLAAALAARVIAARPLPTRAALRALLGVAAALASLAVQLAAWMPFHRFMWNAWSLMN